MSVFCEAIANSLRLRLSSGKISTFTRAVPFSLIPRPSAAAVD